MSDIVCDAQYVNICRSCLCIGNSDDCPGAGIDPNLKNLFYSITGLNIVDLGGYSTWFCDCCKSALHMISTFQKNCRTANSLLARYTTLSQADQKSDLQSLIQRRDQHLIPMSKIFNFEDFAHLQNNTMDVDDDILKDEIDAKELGEFDHIYDADFNFSYNVEEIQAPIFDPLTGCVDINSIESKEAVDASLNDTQIPPDDSAMNCFAIQSDFSRRRDRVSRSRKCKRKKKKVKGNNSTIADIPKRKKIANLSELQNFSRGLQTESDEFILIEMTTEEVLNEMEQRRKTLQAHNICNFCVKGFLTEDFLLSHMKKHEKKSGTFECEICHQYIPVKRGMRRMHYKVHHLRYKCKLCPHVCLEQRQIIQHFNVKHQDCKKYVCDTCGKECVSKRGIDQHVKRHQLKSSRVYCDRCGRDFCRKYALLVHILKKHGTLQPVHMCPKCPKKFRLKNELTNHLKIHSRGYSIVQCANCHRKFNGKEKLKAHLLNIHSNPEISPFPCPQCKQRFMVERKLDLHLAKEHKINVGYPCQICQKRFFNPTKVNRHILITHQRDPAVFKFVCEYCSRKHSSKAQLVNHIRTHTGERPFSCEQCGRLFSQRTAMNLHIKLVHLKLKRNLKKKINPVQKTSTVLADESGTSLMMKSSAMEGYGIM